MVWWWLCGVVVAVWWCPPVIDAYLFPQNGFVRCPSTGEVLAARDGGDVSFDGVMNTITLHGPEEALVLIPHLLGYTPSNHLVFLALESWGEDAAGTRSCLGPIMSIDLSEREMNDEMGIALGRALSRTAIKQAVLVYFRSDVPDVEQLPKGPFAAFATVARHVGDALGPRYGTLLKNYVVGSERWGDLEKGSLTCFDWSELQSRPVAAALVFSGSAPSKQAPRHEIIRRSESERRDAETAGEKWLRNIAGRGKRVTGKRAASRAERLAPSSTQACKEWDRLIARWLDPEKREELVEDTAACGRANAALSLAGVRDRVLHYGINPGEPGHEVMLSELTEAELVHGLTVGVDSRPAVDHVETLIGLLELCASYAGENDPYALSCVGYLSWWYGQNTTAARYVKAALAADGSYPLAVLLGDSLAAMVTPAWLRRQSV